MLVSALGGENSNQGRRLDATLDQEFDKERNPAGQDGRIYKVTC